MKKTKKIQCQVCVEQPIIEIPDIEGVEEGEEIHCPVCEKWIATANINKRQPYWSVEDNEYYNNVTGEIIKDYPIKIIS